MYKIATKHLLPGMITGRGIYHTNGTTLLARGTCLSKAYIRRLQKLEIPYIYVTSLDPALRLFPPSDVLHERTRVRAIRDIFALFRHCQHADTVNQKFLRSTVSAILADLGSRKENLAQVSEIRLYHTYTFSHSVNVTVLALLLGTEMGLIRSELGELALGAMLHDIGKIYTPVEVLNKPQALTAHEAALIRRHPVDGYELLRTNRQISPRILQVVWAHHERIDGCGYPRGLPEGRIHEWAKAVSIADVYDALTSVRPYKRPYSPYLAYKIMREFSQGKFDPKLLQLFFKDIAIYPIGTILRTNAGYAIVKRVKRAQTEYPTVLLFATKRRKLLAQPRRIDLYRVRDVWIECELDENEVADLVQCLRTDPVQYLL